MDSIKALAVTGTQLGLGVLLLAISLCFGLLPLALGVEPMDWRVALGMGLVGGGLSAWGSRRLATTADGLSLQAEKEPEPKKSTLLYGQYLVGVGFALLVVALASSTLLAGLAWSAGRPRALGAMARGSAVGDTWDGSAHAASNPDDFSMLERFGSLFGTSPGEAYFVVTLFVLSTLFAMLGALFFFANALWDRLKDPEREAFDARVFWAGLWFRLGEAVLFNLVFFLLLRTYAADRYIFLPLVSLMVGMFLKTGEAMVTGLAERVFAAFQALVPTSMTAPKMSRTWTSPVGGVPTQEPARTAKLKALAVGLEALKGMHRARTEELAVAQADSVGVYCDYDPSQCKVARIRQEIEFQGLKAL